MTFYEALSVFIGYFLIPKSGHSLVRASVRPGSLEPEFPHPQIGGTEESLTGF